MTINIDTGSLVIGAVDGLASHLKGAGKNFPRIFYVNENPDGVLTGNSTGSDLAIDSAGGKFYLSVGGSSWINCGSTE